MNAPDCRPCIPNEVPKDFWYRAALKLIDSVSDPDHRVDLRLVFEERAAICEYDGNLSRPEAERIAFHELRLAVGDATSVPNAPDHQP
jgi:hypothetical protein